MKNHQRIIQIAFIHTLLLLLLSCNDSSPKNPETKSILAYIGTNNEIIVWNGASGISDTIANLPDHLRIHSLSFLDSNTVVYSISSPREKIAIDKESGDTLKCPCSDEDKYVVKGIVGSGYYHQLEYYIDTVKAISIDEHHTWTNKVIKYESTKDEKVLIHSDYYDKDEIKTSSKDSSYACQYVSHNVRRFQCQENVPDRHVMYSQSETYNGVYYYTKHGNLIKVVDETEELFFVYTEFFEYKFGRGYFHPTLSWDGKTIIVAYSETGFFDDLYKSTSNLLKINTETKEVKTISKENYQYPIFSPNGDYCSIRLVNRPFGHYMAEIQVYDISNSSFIALGDGHSPVWFGSKELKHCMQN